MTISDPPGLADAWKAFERTRDRAECDAVAVRLYVHGDDSALAVHPDLASAEIGLQDRDEALMPGTRRPDGKLGYDCGVVAKKHRTTGVIRFIGPYVHGPAGDEFLYVSFRNRTTKAWIIRLKLRLMGLHWNDVVSADTKGQTFSADISGRTPAHSMRPMSWMAG
jgi:hypothetical protein